METIARRFEQEQAVVHQQGVFLASLTNALTATVAEKGKDKGGKALAFDLLSGM